MTSAKRCCALRALRALRLSSQDFLFSFSSCRICQACCIQEALAPQPPASMVAETTSAATASERLGSAPA
eukprot:CAMPEP_0172693334 /NCGR_PEP_ID=MMETSP1074-20121228/25910_1 /TAXON_ID=2916 /ORGANISM="Ceratium fusus, Strain PA161109" /LENGTH=69 /DNA_ID=CAMNT_0013513693 /DNA_START=112 /DNA_END=321 /DNA_ORIENTATION=+